ncbi:hypothetical protein CLV30_10241 [Haloactinopolyspora alba]|uniref:Uncharacterized protein n=1 Tax=Haloactinopolyspora alba TaxID=648780 RepID=A0A2P8EB08_9ACTN|nr:hypothetical protein [Haloactinopolyspora alba]PSL06656.1 hypothetical protein CLV30_10241 [Haloactinopolyspora alba]
MAYLLIPLVVISLVAVVTLMRWVGHDGGPRPAPLPRRTDEWSPDLPSRPYSLTAHDGRDG